jgi:hypothetical protein
MAFFKFLCFSLGSGVLNWELSNLLFQNMIYQISINKSLKQNFNKKQDGELIQDKI